MMTNPPHCPPPTANDVMDWLPGWLRCPDWRWRRASWLAANKGRLDSRIDDELVACAMGFLGGDQSVESRYKHSGSSTGAFFRETLAIYRAEDPARRDELEAFLLSDAPLSDVGRHFNLSHDVLTAYEQLFFDVRPRIHARDWIMARVIGTSVLRGFAGMRLGTLWKFIGYSAGARVLEAVISATMGRPFPAWLRSAIKGDPAEEARLRLEIRLLVCAMTSPSEAGFDELTGLRTQLHDLRPGSSQSRHNNASPMARLMSQFLRMTQRRAPGGRRGRSAQPRSGSRRRATGEFEELSPLANLTGK